MKIESVDALHALDPYTRGLLAESSGIMEEWSKTECRHKPTGGMEEWAKAQNLAEADQGCDWYHGTWQYLRLLDMVAVPSWYGFYVEALSKVLQSRPEANVLISAAADYGMFAMLHQAMESVQAKPTVVLYDICPTPLRSTEWYAERHGLTIKCVSDNLLTCEVPEGPFDLIITDEFLTVLKSEYKPLITKRWKELLRPGGKVVTTAMIGGPATPELRQGYAERARRTFQSNGKHFPHHENGGTEDLLARFEAFANFHTRHMVTGEDEIRSLFSEFTELSYTRTTTPGENVNPTDSFQIVASV
jgi:2-polyprenyl-3-methyl-5-hydroxy-6-metoxy-1,4-benzoquinol methylase